VQSHFVHAGEIQHQVPDEGYEPQQHVGEVHPYCILHTNLAALVRSRVRVDVNFSKNAEDDYPENAIQVISIPFSFTKTPAVEGEGKGEDSQHNSIPDASQGELGQEEEDTDGRQSAYHDRIRPLRVCADVLPPGLVEIVAIESDDRDGEHELQDAEHKAYVSAKGRAVLE
jgi:hypothetical protein